MVHYSLRTFMTEVPLILKTFSICVTFVPAHDFLTHLMTFHFERKLLELGGLVEMFQADFTSVRERSGVAAPV